MYVERCIMYIFLKYVGEVIRPRHVSTVVLIGGLSEKGP